MWVYRLLEGDLYARDNLYEWRLIGLFRGLHSKGSHDFPVGGRILLSERLPRVWILYNFKRFLRQ